MSEERIKPFRGLWLAGSVIAILLVIVFINAPPSFLSHVSPVYHGRPAEYWLGDVFGVGPSAGSSQTAAINAFRDMGTNGITFLVDFLDQRDGFLHKIYQKTFPQLPVMMQRRLPRPSDIRIRIYRASFVLSNVRDPAPERTFPSLVRYLASANPDTREAAAELISHYVMNYPRMNYGPFQPDLVRALGDTNDLTRLYVATALRDAKLYGPELKAALQPALTNPIPFIQSAAQTILDSLTATNQTAP